MEDMQALVTVAVTAVTIAGLLTVAVLWLFYGWRVYKFFIAALTMVAAGMAGWFFVAPHLPDKFGWTVPIVFAATGGVISFLMQRVVTFAAMGLLGAAISALVAVTYFQVPMDIKSTQLIAITSAGFIVGGIPAAIFHRVVVILVTSGYGALLALSATSTLILICLGGAHPISSNTLLAPLGSWLLMKDVLIAAIVAWIIITIVGTIHQYKAMNGTEPAK